MSTHLRLERNGRGAQRAPADRAESGARCAPLPNRGELSSVVLAHLATAAALAVAAQLVAREDAVTISVARVEFWVREADFFGSQAMLLATSRKAPFTAVLRDLKPGHYMVWAVAVDNGGAGALIGSQRQYPSAVAISVAGGTGNSTLYLVDGGYNNDPLNNIGQPMPFPDALQEFKLENGVRPARYGVYTGATVNAVTKSGSNAFHGDAFAFGRHHAFNSRGYFDIADDGLVRAQTGGTLGGPLIKNKLFFFAGPLITNERVRPTSADTFSPTANTGSRCKPAGRHRLSARGRARADAQGRCDGAGSRNRLP